jgi:hypothetical protein
VGEELFHGEGMTKLTSLFAVLQTRLKLQYIYTAEPINENYAIDKILNSGSLFYLTNIDCHFLSARLSY